MKYGVRKLFDRLNDKIKIKIKICNRINKIIIYIL